MNKIDEQAALAGAQAGDTKQFEDLVNPYRQELLVHCYRTLGSLQDAEDMVQETLLRAWQKLDTFEHIAFRAWLYKIATNACLDHLKKQQRRRLPTQDYPVADPLMPPGIPLVEKTWLDPFPDHRLPFIGTDPEAQYTAKEAVSLAFLAALQLLPARQRAVILLRDVLSFRASETAQVLDMTVSAVNSLLNRARANLNKHYSQTETVVPADDDSMFQPLLDRYQQAWESADVATIIALLKEEVTYAMPPLTAWYQGREAIRLILTNAVFQQSETNPMKLQALRVNGQPGFAIYQQEPTNATFKAIGIQVISIDRQTSRISDVIAFLKPTLFPLFHLPPTLS